METYYPLFTDKFLTSCPIFGVHFTPIKDTKPIYFLSSAGIPYGA